MSSLQVITLSIILCVLYLFLLKRIDNIPSISFSYKNSCMKYIVESTHPTPLPPSFKAHRLFLPHLNDARIARGKWYETQACQLEERHPICRGAVAASSLLVNRCLSSRWWIIEGRWTSHPHVKCVLVLRQAAAAADSEKSFLHLSCVAVKRSTRLCPTSRLCYPFGIFAGKPDDGGEMQWT